MTTSGLQPPSPGRFTRREGRADLANPAAALLLCVFVGANFVAATFLTWLPTFIFEGFDLGLDNSSFTSTFWPLASLPGAICGGIAADRAAPSDERRPDPRARPGADRWLPRSSFLTGWSTSVPVLIAGLIGAGLCKGIYDSNIFAVAFRRGRPGRPRHRRGLDELPGLDRRLRRPLRGRVSRPSALASAWSSVRQRPCICWWVLLALQAARLAEAARPQPGVRLFRFSVQQGLRW